jgi:hypothetical protein
VGVAERELQAAARALSPDGPATAAAQRAEAAEAIDSLLYYSTSSGDAYM